MRSRVGQTLLAAAAVGWLVTLVFASRAVFPVGSVICHQRPERSFVVRGQQLAVCARCTGLYTGAAIAAPLAIIGASAVAASRARRVLLFAAVPTAATWTLEFAGGLQFSNTARFVAALPLGFVAAWLVVQTLQADQPSAR